MQYCKKCVQPDTMPGIEFDDGICMACRFAEQQVDWDARQRELNEIAQWAKDNSHGGFNCVVGVSGGKDSHFQALYAKDKLGLKPLLVNSIPDQITKAGRHNLENLVQMGFDLIQMRPNPIICRSLARRAFFEYGNPVKPSEYPLYASLFHVSLAIGIPLVILGENPAITLGITKSIKPSGDALGIKDINTLAGGQANDWIDKDIRPKDLLFYQFPSKEEIKKKGVKAIFLGYYLKEWSYKGNTDFAVSLGLYGRRSHDPVVIGGINPYYQVDSDFVIANQIIKWYKFGYANVTEEVSYEIREGRMTRGQAIRLVEQYDGQCGDYYLHKLCDYIGVSVTEFWKVVGRFVNKRLFQWDGESWRPLFKVGYGLKGSKNNG